MKKVKGARWSRQDRGLGQRFDEDQWADQASWGEGLSLESMGK